MNTHYRHHRIERLHLSNKRPTPSAPARRLNHRRPNARRTTPLLRAIQKPSDRTAHTTAARPITTYALFLSRPRHTTTAKPASPMHPIAAPAASAPAAARPLIVPSNPILALCSFSWASIKLAPAGKMAGNARNTPPTPGPKRFAIKPAITEHRPPNKKRTAHS
jgi:hypothetical protein